MTRSKPGSAPVPKVEGVVKQEAQTVRILAKSDVVSRCLDDWPQAQPWERGGACERTHEIKWALGGNLRFKNRAFQVTELTKLLHRARPSSENEVLKFTLILLHNL